MTFLMGSCCQLCCLLVLVQHLVGLFLVATDAAGWNAPCSRHAGHVDNVRSRLKSSSSNPATWFACRYVYQKAYVEFFVSPEKFEALKGKMTSFLTLTYMAVNNKGDFHSNQAITLTKSSAVGSAATTR